MSRRTVLQTAAWSAPIITIAIAAPATSASTAQPRTPQNPPGACGGGAHDNGTYFVYDDKIVVQFDRLEQAPHVNVRWKDKSSLNWHFDNYPNGNLNDREFRRMPTVPVIADGGHTLTIPLPRTERPEWVQVAGFNCHYGE